MVKYQIFRPDAARPDGGGFLKIIDGSKVTFIRLEHVEFIGTKPENKIGTDAAYALGEEAFRAGFEAGVSLNDKLRNGEASAAEVDWYRAWSDYEPSEDVKDLIDG